MNVRRVNKREQPYGLSHIMLANNTTACGIYINSGWVCYEDDLRLGPVTCSRCMKVANAIAVKEVTHD